MGVNPFKDDIDSFFVSVNGEEQHSLWRYLHSLWSVFANLPVGQRVVYGEADGAGRLDYIEQNWTNIPPKSLREKLAADRRFDG